MNKSQIQIYRRWCNMRRRCQNKNHHAYKWYGARGIRVCERWLVFENFAADMGPISFEGATIDRKNSDGNYEPDNCRWATMKEQRQNRKDTVILTFNGISKCITQWAEDLKMPAARLRGRIRMGWPIEKAFTAPRREYPTFFHNGQTLSRRDWAAFSGVSYGKISDRMWHGWTIERAINTP